MHTRFVLPEAVIFHTGFDGVYGIAAVARINAPNDNKANKTLEQISDAFGILSSII